MSEPGRRNLFLALCAIALVHNGSIITQSYINYATWHLISPASFPAYHWAMTLRAGPFLLIPRLVEIVIGLIVLRFRPRAIERWVILLGLGLAVGGVLSTALISRPIHAQLDIQGNTPELLSRLMATDWIRNPLSFARAGLYLWALSRLITDRRS